MKVAVSVMAAFIVIVAGFMLVERLPEPVPFQDLNLWPGFAVARIVTFAPELHQPLLGVTDPGPLTSMVR